MVKQRKMRLRRRAREIALLLVYMNEMRNGISHREIIESFPVEESLSLFEGELKADEKSAPSSGELLYLGDFGLTLTDAEKDEVMSYAEELFCGVLSKSGEIEDIIRINMDSKWRPERLVALDKAVIALALYEGAIAKKVPIGVAISEAVDIAKVFGTEESGRFVNGVLGRIARTIDDDKQ